MKRDLRHVLIFMGVVMPVALVATLFTSGTAGVKLKVPVRSPLRPVAAIVKVDAAGHSDAADVSLDRRARLLRPTAK